MASLFICISLDYLITLQEFFLSNLPSGTTEQQNSRVELRRELSATPPRTPTGISLFLTLLHLQNLVILAVTSPSDVNTRLDIIIQNPEIILLENQQNSSSNCLVLDVNLFSRIFKTNVNFNFS